MHYVKNVEENDIENAKGRNRMRFLPFIIGIYLW